MKKRFSLLVAVMMMLSLVPAGVFAVESKFSSTVTVDGSKDEKADFTATFKKEGVDTLKDGTVSVQLLGDDVEFEKLEVTTSTGVGTATKGTYQIFKVNAKADSVSDVKISGTVKFDNASAGEYKIVYDLTGIGLGRHERVYAKVAEASGSFTKLVNSVKKVRRGSEMELASFEVKAKKDQKITVELPSSDLEWNAKTSIPFAKPDADGKRYVVKDRKLTFVMGADKVVVTPFIDITKAASKGDIELDVRKDGDSNTVKVAEYVDYAVSMTLVKTLQEKLANGEKYKVDVKIETTDKDALPRYLDFTVDGADVHVSSNDVTFDGDAAGKDTKGNDKFGDNFELVSTTKNSVKFSLEIEPAWDAEGDVVLKAKGRGMEELSLVVLKVKPVAKMSVASKEALGGDSKVMVNDIVIKETEAAALKPGTMFGVSLKGMKFDDLKFDAKGKIEAEGLKVKDYTLDKDSQTLYFTIDSRSKKDAPATITLKDVEVVSSRALPFGTHKLLFVSVGEFEDSSTVKEVKGTNYAYTSKKTAELTTISKVDFIKVVDKVSKVKKTTVFTLGSADYTVEGAAMKLDTPVFTQDNYTMLPVRAIADALGVEVVWNQENLTATFIDGEIVVSVTQNAKTLYKNGNAYPMVTKATVKADRMFIPVSSVGDAFGLTRGYDYTYDKSKKEVVIYPKAEAVAAPAVEEAKKEEVKKAEEAK